MVLDRLRHEWDELLRGDFLGSASSSLLDSDSLVVILGDCRAFGFDELALAEENIHSEHAFRVQEVKDQRPGVVMGANRLRKWYFYFRTKLLDRLHLPGLRHGLRLRLRMLC